MRKSIATFKQMRGSCYGIIGPQLVFQIELYSESDLIVSSSTLNNTLQEFWPTLHGIEATRPEDSASCFIQTLQQVANVVLREAGKYPITDCRLLGCTVDCLVFTGSVACPMSDFSLAQGLVIWLLDVYHSCNQVKSNEDLIGQFRQLYTNASRLLATTSNTRLFLKAAHHDGIPFRHLGGNLFHFGMGKRGRLLDSSISDQTPWLGVVVAKNKPFCSSMLQMAGLPTPAHILVSTPNEATEAAMRIGYPVVIKPSNMEQGAGVYAGLQNEGELIHSFQEAAKVSSCLMLEKHLEGHDYRLSVFNGRLLWAIERIPAGVTGDGTHAIKDLIELSNSNQQRGALIGAPLKIIRLDDEVIQVLCSQGLTLDSVPPADAFVPLRRKANISAGGTPVSVMGHVHPDNSALAIQVAQTLGLDIAGVDLIMPDISRSWRDVGGGICEVNAQPQLGSVTSSHVYSEILKTMLPHRGRIPTVLVIGEDHKGPVSTALRRMFRDRLGGPVGLADPFNSGIDNSAYPLTSKTASLYQAGTQLVMRKDMEALVLSLPLGSVIGDGIPVDFVDAIVISNTILIASNEQELAFAKMLESLLPHAKRVLALGSIGQSLDDPLSRACNDIYNIEFIRSSADDSVAALEDLIDANPFAGPAL